MFVPAVIRPLAIVDVTFEGVVIIAVLDAPVIPIPRSDLLTPELFVSVILKPLKNDLDVEKVNSPVASPLMLAAYWLAVSKFDATPLPQETDPLPVATKLAVVDLDVGTIVKVGNELEVTNGDLSKPEAETCLVT